MALYCAVADLCQMLSFLIRELSIYFAANKSCTIGRHIACTSTVTTGSITSEEMSQPKIVGDLWSKHCPYKMQHLILYSKQSQNH